MTPMNEPPAEKPKFLTVVGRALRLRCPMCGQTALFRNWSLGMQSECSECGLSLTREPGFYLGSIYVNYGITSVVVLVTYLALTIQRTPAKTKLAICLMIAFLLPLMVFRHARSLWLGMDVYLDR